MKNIIVAAAVALLITSTANHAQTQPGAAQPATPPAATAFQAAQPTVQVAPAANASATEGLSDLDAMTFECPKAALNAAAREAAKAPSEGTYQFAYFRIVSNAHHSAYEVHFKSNYIGEPDLKYCVALYCQQGWDPKKTRADVMLMGDTHRPAGAMAHADCSDNAAPGKSSAKKK